MVRDADSHVSAGSKAEAAAGWDAAVAEWVERLVPTQVVVCDRCDGHGHLLADNEHTSARSR